MKIMVGMSGSFVPYVKLYDKFFFTPEPEPCRARYNLDKALHDLEGIDVEADTSTFDNYIQWMENCDRFKDPLKYEKIEIVEKEPEDIQAAALLLQGPEVKHDT